MLLWERIAPSHVGKGGFAPIMRLTGAISLTGGFLYFYARSISRQPLRPTGDMDQTNNCESAILWGRGERARSGDGHEGDGGQSQEGRTTVWEIKSLTIYAGGGSEEFKILRCLPARDPVVQLCQPQPGKGPV